MEPIDQQMARYAAYHRHPWNRLTHFFGVPLIMFSIFVPLSWVGFSVIGLPVTIAIVLAVAVLGYYFMLDVPLAVALTLFTALLLAAAHWVATSQTAVTGWMVFAACFGGGWILQIAGHVFEGRRPALVDNIWQIFVAPLFLMAEVFFALGFKHDVRDRVRESLGES